MPSKEEIDKITTKMISQVHSNYSLRNRAIENDAEKTSSIFIKDIAHKMEGDSKKTHTKIPKAKDNKDRKWEPKKNCNFKQVTPPRQYYKKKFRI